MYANDSVREIGQDSKRIFCFQSREEDWTWAHSSKLCAHDLITTKETTGHVLISKTDYDHSKII